MLSYTACYSPISYEAALWVGSRFIKLSPCGRWPQSSNLENKEKQTTDLGGGYNELNWDMYRYEL